MKVNNFDKENTNHSTKLFLHCLFNLIENSNLVNYCCKNMDEITFDKVCFICGKRHYKRLLTQIYICILQQSYVREIVNLVTLNFFKTNIGIKLILKENWN